MSHYIIKNLQLENDQVRKYSVLDYNNNKVKIYGTIVLNCIEVDTTKNNLKQNNNNVKNAKFLVVDNNNEPILGLSTSIKFGLIKRLDIQSLSCLPQLKENFVQQFKDLFEGLGKFPSKQTIVLKENSSPVLHYKKRVPLSLLDPLKKTLFQMAQDNRISPVSYPTDWVNNLQIVEKSNGQLRICLDPKPLNGAIKREHFLIPTMEDFTSRMEKNKCFTVLDLSSGFWQMELDNPSSELNTFMTPFGRYKFNRVPFGISCAPEMFQREMIKMFGDITGVVVYFDDICIMGEDEQDHDRILLLVMQRARQNGVKFNKDKLQYRTDQVKFMGHILSQSKVEPQRKYIDAIKDIQTPKNKHDVMRILGLFKYLAKFIPNLSEKSFALRNLTRNDVEFCWHEEHKKELENLLNIISTKPVLSVYKKNKQITIQTDASKDGLGCVLVQEGHPVASRTLSKNEQKWAQIEKELLAIVFACERFHYFVYGREFVVESDHKPLETLIKRDLDDVTARLQSMLMSLLKYPKIEVIYKPGKDMLVADCLSRAPLPEVMESPELANVIHSVVLSVCLSEENYKLYQSVIKDDETIKKICSYVSNGWPVYTQLDEVTKHFHKLKSELHIEKNLLFFNNRLVVPRKLQNTLVKWLHATHLGVEKTLARARLHYYWPNMNKEIKETVTACSVCEKFKRKNQKEPLLQDETPKYPFDVIGIDIFEYAGLYFISILDAYSGFLIADQLGNKSAKNVVEKLIYRFNQVGYPTNIRCDNNPFNSEVFEKFADKFNIRIKYSSPHYSQSNGLAEKGVAIAKNILKRCYEVNESSMFQYRLLEYNTVPVASMKLAPCELFFGRLIKTQLPISKTLLFRNNLTESQIKEKLEIKKERQKYYYDKNAKMLCPLDVGDQVMFKKNSNEWIYGIIINKVNDRSYIIKDNYNSYFRRNRRFIQKTRNNEVIGSELLYDEDNEIVQNCENKDVYNQCGDDGLWSESGANEEPVVVDSDGDSLGFETAESDDDFAEQLEAVASDNRPTVSRFGRVIKPPQRYGHD